MSECVKVVVRCRPMNSKERALSCNKIVSIDPSTLQVEITKPRILGSEQAAVQQNSGRGTDKSAASNATTAGDGGDFEPKAFTFDGVFDDDSTQQAVYEQTAHSLVQSVSEGYNGTIFAYGQTGCGKTFTMEGVRNTTDPLLKGIIPNTFEQMFNLVSTNPNPRRTYLIRASYLEIYNEEVRDLCSDDPKKRCEIKEDKDSGVYVKGLINQEVTNVYQLQAVMDRGNSNRTVGATLMNADSSRSHSLFTITIECSEPDTVKGGDEMKIKAGKLNLVDLAGSERQSKTQAAGVRLKEATKINLSLSALGNVIEALVKVGGGDKTRHIPYRDSKLTRLLQDSLGGNTKTVMIAAISPADYNYDETLSTLRYANRAKNIKNKPKVNEDPKDALLREYQDEIKRLKMLLEERGLDNAVKQSKMDTAVVVKGAKKPVKKAPTKKAAAQIASEDESASDDDEEEDNSHKATVKAENGKTANKTKRSAAVAPADNSAANAKSPKTKQRTVADTSANGSSNKTILSSAEQTRLSEVVADITTDIESLSAERDKHKSMLDALQQQLDAALSDPHTDKNELSFIEWEHSLRDDMDVHDNTIQQLKINIQNKKKEQILRQEELNETKVLLQVNDEQTDDLLKNKLISLQTKLMSGNDVSETNNDSTTTSTTTNNAASDIIQSSTLSPKSLPAASAALSSSSSSSVNTSKVNDTVIQDQLRQQRELDEQHHRLLLKEKEMEIMRKNIELENIQKLKEEEKLFIEEKYSDITQAAHEQKIKLKKLIHKYNILKREKDDAENEWSNEKDTYLNNIREILKESKLYSAIVSQLTTQPFVDKILTLSQWDESREEWNLPVMEMPVVLPAIRNYYRNGNVTQVQQNKLPPNSSGGRGPGSSGSGRSGSGESNGNGHRVHYGRAAPVRNDSSGADADWKRSVVSSQQSQAQYSPPSNSHRGISPTKLSNRLQQSNRPPNDASAFEAQHRTMAHGEVITEMTSTVRRRAAFEPVATQQFASTEEKHPEDDLAVFDSLPKRPAFQPATLAPSAMDDDDDSTHSILTLTESVPKRPAFQPFMAPADEQQRPRSSRGGNRPRQSSPRDDDRFQL